LPPAVLQKMESFFKTSFADVRVHIGAQAPSIGAVAFTQGSNLYFAPGEYNPVTSQGQRLLGHELSHVVQQRMGRVRNPFGTGIAVVRDRVLEAEADRMGHDAALHQVPVQPKLSVTARLSPPPKPVMQRRPVAQARTVVAGGVPSLAAPRHGAIPIVVQPKVVVHGAGHDPRNDYALMKVLHQITRRTGAGYSVTELNGATDFSDMQANEILYIAGHGNYGTGEIRGLPSATLLGYLNHPHRGIPANIGGINILTCYGGLVRGGGQSLAQRIAAGLNHQGIPVRGAMGYSFGTPQSASTGLNSVLSTDLDGFYSQSDPEDTMLQQLKDRMTAHGVDGNSLYKSEGTSDDALRRWIRKFIHRRDAFQRNMESVIASYSGRGSLNVILDELRHDHKFQRLVNRQYELHKYLFELPGAASYASATS
jgi:hypothetical protein